MINALNLLWIVPISTLVGMFIVSLVSSSADADRDSRIYQEGVQAGIQQERNRK